MPTSTPIERIEELFTLIQQEELPTLQALDRRLHALLEQKAATPQQADVSSTVLEEFHHCYPRSTIHPDLLALVGVHPANPLEEDKQLIHDQIARSVTG